jgi:hypothetical protein
MTYSEDLFSIFPFYLCLLCMHFVIGLPYKHIVIKRDVTIWSVTLESSILFLEESPMTLEIVNYNCNHVYNTDYKLQIVASLILLIELCYDFHPKFFPEL